MSCVRASPQGAARPADTDGAKPRSAASGRYRDQGSPQPAQQTGRSSADSGRRRTGGVLGGHVTHPGRTLGSFLGRRPCPLPASPPPLSRPILPVPSRPLPIPPVPIPPGRPHASLPPGNSCPSCLLCHSRSSRHAPAASAHPRAPGRCGPSRGPSRTCHPLRTRRAFSPPPLLSVRSYPLAPSALSVPSDPSVQTPGVPVSHGSEDPLPPPDTALRRRAVSRRTKGFPRPLPRRRDTRHRRS